jgi:hypothetical protein
MAFVRSRALAGDGRPRVTGVGARLTRRGLRVHVLHVAERTRAGRARCYLETNAGREPVTIILPRLEVGAYLHSTLEVPRE